MKNENELSALSRRGQLLEILREQEQVTVKEMARKFGVSEMTIREGDVIFLDTSTTILLMLRYLPDIRLTVITNSFPVAQELCGNTHICLYLTSGMYQEQYGGPLDYSTAEYVSRFHYDKAFFGASAVDASFGASATREIESAVKRCVWTNASESYLLADHTKFGKKNLIRYNEVRDYRLILTDDELDDETQKDFYKHGGTIQICI